jgi:hypothetical protein
VEPLHRQAGPATQRRQRRGHRRTQHNAEEATALIEAFLQEPFSNDERHIRRIGKIATYETTGEVVG